MSNYEMRPDFDISVNGVYPYLVAIAAGLTRPLGTLMRPNDEPRCYKVALRMLLMAPTPRAERQTQNRNYRRIAMDCNGAGGE